MLLWLYNLFVRDPAPYKCSDQTRTICVNTKAERHVVAKSGDNTIPLPFNINNIHVLSHYCCIFGLNVITLWPSGLYIYVFLAYMEATLIN